MAKARITDNIGEGLYGIELEYDSSNLDNQIAALAQQLIDIEQLVLDAQVAVIEAEDVRDSLANDLDLAIDAYAAGGESEPVIAATKALAEAVSALNTARFKVQRISGQKLSLAARKTRLENTIIGSQASASDRIWCADYSTDLDPGTSVPVAITPGEIGPGSEPWVILPQQHPDGYGGDYNRALHGQLVPRLSMTPAATFYHWALLPGWQRWMPTHRIGTLTFVDQATDTCNVTLETARSSAGPWPYPQGLNVNLFESTATVLEGVPIRYMTCNAAVFEVGDRVLVRFAQPSKATAGPGAWDEAEVIGFVSNPRACDIFYSRTVSDVVGPLTETLDEQFLPEPDDGPGGVTEFVHSQSMSVVAEPFDYFSGNNPPVSTISVSYSYLQTQNGEYTPIPGGHKLNVTNEWDVSAEVVINVGGLSFVLMSIVGDQIFRSGADPAVKTTNHTLISRNITRSTADGRVWFGSVEHSVISYSAGSGTHDRTQYNVVSVDGTEYIIDTVELDAVLSLSPIDADKSGYCVFYDTLAEKLNGNAKLTVNDDDNFPNNKIITIATAPILPTFLNEILISDSEKLSLAQARNGELPVLSL